MRSVILVVGSLLLLASGSAPVWAIPTQSGDWIGGNGPGVLTVIPPTLHPRFAGTTPLDCPGFGGPSGGECNVRVELSGNVESGGDWIVIFQSQNPSLCNCPRILWQIAGFSGTTNWITCPEGVPSTLELWGNLDGFTVRHYVCG